MTGKSILIIPTPRDCEHCDLPSTIDEILGRVVCWEDEYGKHCPLRPLPKKQKLIVTGKNQIEKKKIIESKSLEWIKKGYINNPEVAFYCGYNECLDEITGEVDHE